jgi:hypothetical protein
MNCTLKEASGARSGGYVAITITAAMSAEIYEIIRRVARDNQTSPLLVLNKARDRRTVRGRRAIIRTIAGRWPRLTNGQIGEMLGMSASGVLRHLYRAESSLRGIQAKLKEKAEERQEIHGEA